LAEASRVGALTAPIRLQNGYAIAVLDGVQPADGARFDEVRDELERIARRRQERLLMEDLGRRLLAGVDIVPREAAWSAAWRWRPEPERPNAAAR
jgi:parvulin-like peptidyl-prolyl isomerase